METDTTLGILDSCTLLRSKAVGCKMESSSAIFVFMCSTVFVSWLFRVIYSIWWKPMELKLHLKKQGINGPPYRLLYGNLKENVRLIREARSKPMKISHQIIPRVLPLYHNTMKNYGKMCLIWFGTNPRVNVMDPELIKEILCTKVGHFEKPRSNPFAKLLAAGLANYEGEKWARHRRILNPAFHLEKLKRMVPSFITSCIELIKRWEISIGPQGSCELDVWAELENLSGDVISRTAFGSNYEEGKQILKLQKEQAELVIKAAQTVCITGFRFLPTKNNLRRKELVRDVRAMLQAMIEKRAKAMKAGEASADDLLGLLMESIHNGSYDLQEHGRNSKKIGMTIDEVIEECKLFYFAGQGTTSVLLTWTMISLSMHPDWQVRARDEVLQVCGKNTPDFGSLNRLKIVTMILHEVLRLYPPVVYMVRQTYKWLTLGDLSLPPGVQLLLPMLLIHHDREIWGDDAEEFQPERFTGGVSKATKGRLAFFPFGWGPRICIGQNFAMIEAKMALAMILQHFSFELSPSYVHAPCAALILQPQHGAQIVLHKL